MWIVSSLRAATLAAGALGWVGAASALDVSRTDFYPCEQGNCVNGYGVVRDVVYSKWIEGNWRAAQTIPGERYLVSHPQTRGKKYEQYYGADGLIERGTTLRVLGTTGRSVPMFTGTYTRIDHPFMRQRIATPQEGVYTLGNGLEYRGQFDYLPVKGYQAGQITMGHFIFFGEKVDTEDDTRETGLFVSDTSVSSGAVIRFVKARPDYMVVLQQQFQRDQMMAADDFQQQERDKAWRTAFAILGQVALGMAGSGGGGGFGGGNMSGGQKFALDLVGGMMRGTGAPAAGGAAASGDPSTRLIQMVTGAALGKITGDKALSNTLSKAVAEGIEKANNGAK